MMATRNGLVKKTPLEAYGRPMKGGIIAIKLEGRGRAGRRGHHEAGRRSCAFDRHGMAIRFKRRGCPADGPQYQRREGDQAHGRRSAGRHGRRRSRRHAAHRLREGLRQADPVRPEQPCDRRRRRGSQRWAIRRERGRGANARRGGRSCRRERGRHLEPAALSHSAPRRQGTSRHQDDRPQRPGHRRDRRDTTTTSC